MNGRIALFLHQPYCSVQSGNGIMRALEDHYSFKIFTRHDLERDFFDDVDMICFPGGLGDASNFDFLTREHKLRIRKFVKQGGAYLGICMGAYWAGSQYFDILKGIDVVQYIKLPTAEIRRPYGTVAEITYESDFSKDRMFFYDGGAVIDTDIHSTYQVKARYKNGKPMALIQRNVGIIGCHPESEEFWYELYPYINNKWHKRLRDRWITKLIQYTSIFNIS